jgi:hypothetical protein
MYQGADPKILTKRYRLPHIAALNNWIAICKKTLGKGAVPLTAMGKPKKPNGKTLQNRIKELKVPVRKKPGTKQ